MRFVHTNLVPLLVTLALLATAVVWFSVPEPVAPNPPPKVADAWRLPAPADRNATKSLEAIAARNLWGTIVVSTTPKEPEWRVQGIASNGSESFVLIAFEGKPIEILKIGDALPDGTKIVQIEKNRFFVLTPDKKKVAFGIYKNVTQN